MDQHSKLSCLCGQWLGRTSINALGCNLRSQVCFPTVDEVGYTQLYTAACTWIGRGKYEIKCNLCADQVNTFRPRQNGRHFADDVFKCIFLTENVWILLKISLKFVPKGPINNIPSLVQVMAWRRPGDKPLSEPMMVSLLTHICVARIQWVKAGLRLCLSSFKLATYTLDQGVRPKEGKSNILLVSTCLFHNIWATVVQLFPHLSPEDMIQVYR